MRILCPHRPVRAGVDERVRHAVPATLTERLAHLVEEGVVDRVPGAGARDEYVLTAKGQALWPVIAGLAQWGNENYVAAERRMSFRRRGCDAMLDAVGACTRCGVTPAAADVVVQRPTGTGSEPFANALREPHRLLEPLRV